MKKIPVLLITALVVVSASGFLYDGELPLEQPANPCTGPGSTGKTNTIVEVSLGKRPPGIIDHSLLVSPDGNHIAFVTRQGSTKSVVVDGRAGKAYPEIPEQPLTERGRARQIKFSPDSKRTAYVAQNASGCFVVVDGVEGSPFESIEVGAPVFSPDSKRIAYIARREGKEVVVVDGAAGPPCDYVEALPIKFSPDSKHMAYAARRANSSIAVMDGKEIDRAEFIGFIRFSNDGRRHAYVAMNGQTRRVVVDGLRGAEYSQVGNEIFFSSDGKHVMYRATGAGGNFIVLDGVEGKYRGIIRENDYDFSPDGKPVYLVEREAEEVYCIIGQEVRGPYDRVIGMPRFSADGSRVAYAAISVDRRKQFVVTDGAEGPPFDSIDTLEFSPKGNRLLYTASLRAKHYMVLDGVQTEYDAVPVSAFSPDGEHLALLVKIENKWVIMVDGNRTDAPCGQVSQLVLGRGGKHLAFVCNRRHQQLAVIDGTEGKPYDNVSQVAFSSGGSAAYIGVRDGRRIVVIDNAEVADFDSVLTSLIFDGPSSLHFIGVKNGEFFREEIKLDK
jgi:Tol biopolymer transport system component